MVVPEWIRSVEDGHVELLAGREPGEYTYITKLSSTLTILTPPRKQWLHSFLPSLPVMMEASTLLSKRPNILTTQQQLQKYINTTILRTSKLGLM